MLQLISLGGPWSIAVLAASVLAVATLAVSIFRNRTRSSIGLTFGLIGASVLIGLTATAMGMFEVLTLAETLAAPQIAKGIGISLSPTILATLTGAITVALSGWAYTRATPVTA